MANALVSSITSAIAQMEGSNPSTNNPGNIMDLQHYRDTGQFRVQQYPSSQAGQDALESLTNNYINKGYSLYDFFSKYAPYGHGSNDPVAYAQFVGSKIGLDPSLPLNTVDGVPTYSTTVYAMAPLEAQMDSEGVIGDGMGGQYPQLSPSSLDASVVPGGIVGIGLLLLVGLGIYVATR